jgi:hypothetical protein
VTDAIDKVAGFWLFDNTKQINDDKHAAWLEERMDALDHLDKVWSATVRPELLFALK